MPKIGETGATGDSPATSQGGSTGTVIDKLLEAQHGQAWELKTPGGPRQGAVPTVL